MGRGSGFHMIIPGLVIMQSQVPLVALYHLIDVSVCDALLEMYIPHLKNMTYTGCCAGIGAATPN